MIYRERKCLTDKEKLYCLILAPKGCVTPFPWPKSHDHGHYAEVHTRIRQLKKAVQNWVQPQRNLFGF
ncbi:hypothetical protein BHM03_00033096 [Ensete ventricosum]|uniref:Methyltransferase n=1 Tax=Ensete ventricosum TaxID=4639 RepID=A0A445MIQ7_ENSVE|nr:hypothetical protein BHM03_00033096 [Ensete ventricosum]